MDTPFLYAHGVTAIHTRHDSIGEAKILSSLMVYRVKKITKRVYLTSMPSQPNKQRAIFQSEEETLDSLRIRAHQATHERQLRVSCKAPGAYRKVLFRDSSIQRMYRTVFVSSTYATGYCSPSIARVNGRLSGLGRICTTNIS